MTKVIDFVVTWVDVNNEIYSNNLTKINYLSHFSPTKFLSTYT